MNMAYVKLIDDAENPLFAENDGRSHQEFVRGVAMMRIQNVDHNFDPDYREYSYKKILALIKDSSEGTEINIRGVGEWSPEYLTLLVQITKNCNRLQTCDLVGDLAFGCLAGALIQQDNLRELNVESHSNALPMSSSQAKLLFAGVASSPSLEKFQLCSSFADNEVAGHYLIEAIQQNLHLRSLDLSVTSANHTGFLNFFQTAVLQTRVRHLRVRDNEDMPWTVTFQRLAKLLCHEDCALESLDLGLIHVDQTQFSDLSQRNEQQAIVPNMSVNSLILEPTTLSGSRLGDTLRLFGSLVKLSLWNRRITCLDPLYPLLIGDSLTLQSMILGGLGRGMAEHVALLFCKLPLMTCLRELDISCTSFCFESSWWMTILELTLWQNKSLECFYFEDIQESEFDSKLSVPLSLNRGGRRAMEIGSREELPENLWPLILERASRIHYYDFCSTMEEADLESTRVDVVYWLLKEQMLGRYPSMS